MKDDTSSSLLPSPPPLHYQWSTLSMQAQVALTGAPGVRCWHHTRKTQLEIFPTNIPCNGSCIHRETPPPVSLWADRVPCAGRTLLVTRVHKLGDPLSTARDDKLPWRNQRARPSQNSARREIPPSRMVLPPQVDQKSIIRARQNLHAIPREGPEASDQRGESFSMASAFSPQ